jgi:glycosyltransferase involved in cell wall biosynthesis
VEKTGTSNILLIIPCFNEERNIEALFNKIKSITIPGCKIQPLFINDASSDGTLDKFKQLNLSFLDNPVNLGIGGTVQLGFIYGFENNFDIAIQMDGDGQHPPAEGHKLITPVIKGDADVVIGSRFLGNEGFRSTFMRRFGIKIFLVLNRFLAGSDIKDTTSGFRCYNRKAMEKLVEYYPDEYPEPEAIVYLANKNMRIIEVPVVMNERQAGISSIRRLSSVYYMAKVTLNILFLHLRMKNERSIVK